MISSDCWTAPPELWNFHLVKRASAETNGQWFLGREAIVTSCGPHSAICLHPAVLGAAMKGRATVAAITGHEQGWTTGQQARRIVKWLGIKRRASSLAAQRLAETEWHYRLCSPGWFEYGELWDIRAAYWQIVRRFETPAIIWTDEGFIPVWVDDETMLRWQILMERLEPDKRLRNALVGAMIGGGQGTIAFKRGELFSLPRVRGPMHDLGAAVVRICYEACELQAQHSDAVYSNTDNVIMPSRGRPTVWDDLGLTSRMQSRGDVDVRCVGCYRVGDRATDFYDGETNASIPERSPQLAQAGYWRFLTTHGG